MVKGSPIGKKRCKNCEALWICHYLQYTKSSKDYKNQEKFLCARDKVENQYWRQNCIKIRILPCSGSLVNKSAFNQQHHTHQAACSWDFAGLHRRGLGCWILLWIIRMVSTALFYPISGPFLLEGHSSNLHNCFPNILLVVMHSFISQNLSGG